VPGTTPCQNANAFLAGLGVNLGLSSGSPGPNSALVQQNNHAIAPRVGIAWDVRGDGKTAVRIGAGEFFQREAVGPAERMANNAPFVLGINTNRSMDAITPLSSASVSPSANRATGGNIPLAWQWNLSVEQEVARNTTLQVGYVGNVGNHLTSMYDANAVPSASFLDGAFQSGNAQNALRPAYNFGMIGGFNRGGHASYNSLQALFRMQTGNFSTFQAAYSWSHSVGNVELNNSSGSVNQQAITDRENPGLDKGNTNINRPNIFVANWVAFLPKLEGQNQWVRQILGSWEANSIFSMAQGSSFSVFSSGASGACTWEAADGTCMPGYSSSLSALVGTGYTNNQRALVTQVPCDQGKNGPNLVTWQHFSLAGYALGTFPSNLARRGACFGAPNTNFDGQLAKNWVIKEKYRIKFSMDFFDLFNHPNFNSANLEGSGFTSGSPLLCGGAQQAVPGGGPSGLPCSPTNNIVTGSASGSPTAPSSKLNTPSGFASANSQNLNAGRVLQYTFRFTF